MIWELFIWIIVVLLRCLSQNTGTRASGGTRGSKTKPFYTNIENDGWTEGFFFGLMFYSSGNMTADSLSLSVVQGVNQLDLTLSG